LFAKAFATLSLEGRGDFIVKLHPYAIALSHKGEERSEEELKW
jgi:hypothetical protein